MPPSQKDGKALRPRLCASRRAARFPVTSASRVVLEMPDHTRQTLNVTWASRVVSGRASPAFRPAGAGGKNAAPGHPGLIEGLPGRPVLAGPSVRVPSRPFAAMPRTGRTPGHAGRCRSSRRAPSGPYRRERRSPPAPAERTPTPIKKTSPWKFSPRAHRADQIQELVPETLEVLLPRPSSGPGWYTLSYNSFYRAAPPFAPCAGPIPPPWTRPTGAFHRAARGRARLTLPSRLPLVQGAPSPKAACFQRARRRMGKPALRRDVIFPCRRRSEEKGVVAAHAFRRERRIDHEPFHKSECVTPVRCYDREHDESYRGGVSRHGSQTT